MTNEIKEILEFKEDADYKKLSVDEIVELENYITNLQEKNIKLNNIIDELEKYFEYGTKMTCGMGITSDYIYAYENALNKLQELKEGK